jgi:hypothetical protein
VGCIFLVYYTFVLVVMRLVGSYDFTYQTGIELMVVLCVWLVIRFDSNPMVLILVGLGCMIIKSPLTALLAPLSVVFSMVMVQLVFMHYHGEKLNEGEKKG